MIKNWLSMASTGALALVLLAACGGSPATPPEGEVTRIPDAANAPTEAPATASADEAADIATEESIPTSGSPVASPVAADEEEGTPVAVSDDETAASPVAVVSDDEGTPVSALSDASTPVSMTSLEDEEATPVVFASSDDEATPTMVSDPDEVNATPMTNISGEQEPVASPFAGATPAATPESGSTPAASGDAAANAVTVTSYDIYYEPKTFSIPADTDVTVALPNEGASPHSFVISDHKNPDVPNLDISVQMNAGETKTVTINAPAGTYYFYCDIPGHEAAGMFGTMTVQ